MPVGLERNMEEMYVPVSLERNREETFVPVRLQRNLEEMYVPVREPCQCVLCKDPWFRYSGWWSLDAVIVLGKWSLTV